MPINLMDSFDGSSFDTSKWSVTAKAGATATIENGRAKLLQASGWAGVAIQSPVFSSGDVRKKFSVEFELQMSATNYQVGNAGILPYFGFVPDGVARDSSYYWGVSKGVVFQWNNANIAYVKKTGSTNATVSVYNNMAYSLGIVNRKVKIEIMDGNMTFSIDNVVVASLVLPADFESYMGENIRFEFFQGNYNSGQAIFLDNVTIKTNDNKFLFRDGDDIKTYTPTVTKSLAFDGNDYVNLNSLAGSLVTGDSISLTAWFKTTYKPGVLHGSVIFSAHNSSGSSNIFRVGVSNKGGIYYSPDSGTNDQGRGDDYADGQWHHLAVTVDGDGRVRIFVDAQEISGYNGVRINWSSAAKFSIGQEWDNGSTSDHYRGNLSDIKLFKRLLEVDEITREFNRESIVDDTILVHWDFKNSNGSTLIEQNGVYVGSVIGAQYSEDVPSNLFAWEPVGIVPVTKEMFDTRGMNNLSPINEFALDKLGDVPELLCWTDEKIPTASDSIREPVITETTNGQIKEFSINQEMYYNSIGSITKG
jgi:hypothetical protein